MEVYVVVEGIGKVFINCTKKGKEYYKEIDNKLVSLNEEELEIVNELLKSNESTTFYSKELQNYINNNPYLSRSHDIIDDFLLKLEKYIPEEYRKNYYQNVQNFKFKMNKEDDPDNEDAIGSYSATENKLNVFLKVLSKKAEAFIDTPDPEMFFKTVYENTIYHELFHMASSKNHYEYVECGFTTLPSLREEEKNRGITEGMTEMLVSDNRPRFFDSLTGYYPELCFARQLTALVGRELMYDCYFNNKGVLPIIKVLNTIYNPINEEANMTESERLFQVIEINFIIKGTNTNQSSMAYIQNTLIEYLKQKVERDLKDNVPERRINNYIKEFEQGLLNVNVLSASEEDINYYDFLYESLSTFENFKYNYYNRESKISL